MNMVQIMYTYVCKCKNDTCWNCFRNQESGGDISGGIWYIVRILVNSAMCPHPAQ
jgi:hypothetical protein